MLSSRKDYKYVWKKLIGLLASRKQLLRLMILVTMAHHLHIDCNFRVKSNMDKHKQYKLSLHNPMVNDRPVIHGRR